MDPRSAGCKLSSRTLAIVPTIFTTESLETKDRNPQDAVHPNKNAEVSRNVQQGTTVIACTRPKVDATIALVSSPPHPPLLSPKSPP